MWDIVDDKLHEEQADFGPKQSCAEQIFTLPCVISQKCAKKCHWPSSSSISVKPLIALTDLLFGKFSPHTEYQASGYVPLRGSTRAPDVMYK